MGAKADSIPAPAPGQDWGLVTVACASLRAEPRHGAELETQAILGTPVLLDSLVSGEWRMITLPDGYHAWMHVSAFSPRTSEQMEQWRRSDRLILTARYGSHILADTLSLIPVSDITFGAIVQGTVAPGSRYTRVSLPDGRSGFILSSMLEPFSQWAARRPSFDNILFSAEALTGVSYLWGGTTAKALDCSGFTQESFRHAGILLPRNASAQARIGEEIPAGDPEKWLPGDLLFFGPDPDTTRITHVAIYLGSGRYIHCSGMVMTSSIRPEDPLYLSRKVIAVRRVPLDYNRISRHPWYF